MLRTEISIDSVRSCRKGSSHLGCSEPGCGLRSDETGRGKWDEKVVGDLAGESRVCGLPATQFCVHLTGFGLLVTSAVCES